jgi:phenylacetate-coenzyme A ligase PaaK-like adenylate-forming protein
MSLQDLFDRPQYSVPQAEKEAALLAELNLLTEHHRAQGPDYRKLLDVMHGHPGRAESLDRVPYLPVGLFKSHALRSVPESEVFKTLQSSGTTGQRPSRIVLDRETAQRQTLALSRIMTHVLGPSRLPMILADHAGLVQDRSQFNARAAGALGMMNFGRAHFYALDGQLALDLDGLRAFLAKFGDQPFLIFGFTFVVWKYFFEPLVGQGLDLSRGILIHSGGWKKLQDQAVSAEHFRRHIRETTGLARSYNFYGMVEQVGSVFLEGEDGYLYPPNFADVIVRDPVTLEPLPPGETGVLHVLSALPRSYPGHSLLTEDLGVVHHVDKTASCGRAGKAFSVVGRIPRAELRGCSDVIAAQVG